MHAQIVIPFDNNDMSMPVIMNRKKNRKHVSLKQQHQGNLPSIHTCTELFLIVIKLLLQLKIICFNFTFVYEYFILGLHNAQQ